MIMTTITINNNYNMKRIVFAFLALVMSCQLFAQSKLTGTILDGSMNNEPLIGASVIRGRHWYWRRFRHGR